MQLHLIEFLDITINGGRKEIFKIPSYMNFLHGFGLFINNSFTTTVPQSYANYQKMKFCIANYSILMSNNNDKIILDGSINHFDFVNVYENKSLFLPTIRLKYSNIYKNIYTPINKKVIKNSFNTIVFKEHKDFTDMKTLGIVDGNDYGKYEPNASFYLFYD